MTTLDGWSFTQDEHGDWRGTHVSGRRTALKALLRGAQADVEQGRLVCSAWPSCEHYGPEGCTRAMAGREYRRAAA